MPIWSQLAVAAALPGVRCRQSLLPIALLFSIANAVPAHAGPSVAELLAVCEGGRAAGNRGVDAAICEWYAVPCDCKPARTDADAQRWCLPQSESLDSAMLRVVGELRRVPDRAAAAEQVVPGILSRLYPCSGTGAGER
jgi:hypothetical protein